DAGVRVGGDDDRAEGRDRGVRTADADGHDGRLVRVRVRVAGADDAAARAVHGRGGELAAAGRAAADADGREGLRSAAWRGEVDHEVLRAAARAEVHGCRGEVPDADHAGTVEGDRGPARRGGELETAAGCTDDEVAAAGVQSEDGLLHGRPEPVDARAAGV